MPVMEGKCMLFKEFAGIDAFPIVLNTKDPDAIVATVEAIAPGFGGINLEDISAPRCFEIEDRLKASLDIPVFHDDQHGTAVVTLAALLNAVKITGKRLEDLNVLIVGLGAAGVAVGKIFRAAGVGNQIVCDSRGALHTQRADYLDGSMPAIKRWFAEETNPEGRTGGPADVIDGADLFVGLSGARVMPPAALARMNDDAMVFAMANPNPEVTPEEAAPYARIIATGRSDYPNQINNVLCFPGVFRGALDVRARDDHRGDEDGGRARDRRDRRRRRAARGLHRPLRLQPRRRDRRRRRGRRPGQGAGRRRRPPGTRSATPPATRRTSARSTRSRRAARTPRWATSPSAVVRPASASAA